MRCAQFGTAPSIHLGGFPFLAALLSRISGKFLLSVNDVPEMRETFSRFTIESVATRYAIAGGKGLEVAEIAATGPSPDAVPPARDLLSL
jgi:DNA adenine methylase